MATAFTPRVLSGIQPSGGLTLGNYLGALKRFVEMQSIFQTTVAVVSSTGMPNVDSQSATRWAAFRLVQYVTMA